jgi:phosphate-selective porin OprO/OprP
LYAQSELRYAFVQLTNGNTVTLPTFYVQSGYFLTGEKRPYSRQNAVFGRVKPLQDFGCGGSGAWEATARYSYANFNRFQNGVFGNELSNVTLGLNWYLNQYTKFQFNWIHSLVNSGAGLYSESDIFAVRAQLDF